MIFGKTGQRQGKNQPNTPEYNAGEPAGAPQPYPYAGTGFPAQPSGTGYAGYTPGQQTGGGAYPGGYAVPGQSGSAQTGSAYSGYAQTPPGYGQAAAGFGQAYSQPGAGYAQPSQGYARTGAGADPSQGYARTGAGYAAPQGYPQQGTGYAQPQGFRQTGQNYAQPQAYPPAGQGYPQGQGGYAYPQMNVPGYGPQGGAAQQPQGYTQGGYSPYAQMGRNQTPPQEYTPQIPLNGGGYVPPAVPVKKQPFVFQSWMLYALGGVLIALFAAGLALQMKPLLWAFAALAAASVALFWIRPLISGNRRLCYTIIFGVLSLIALLSALGVLSPQPRDTTRTPGQTAAVTAQPSGGGQGNPAGTVIDPQTGAVINSVQQAEVTATPTPAVEDTTTSRLESFFRFWSANKQDEMLTLCSPSWQSSVDNPKTALFGLLANRTPLDYTVESVSGTAEDTTRKVTVTSTIDRNNGKAPVKYRLTVLMQREGDQWYVDPQSLKTYDEAETPDPALANTPTPTPEPSVNASTVLYYNPDGGTKYHLDQNCKSTHAKYLPLKGHFTYGEINNDKYVKLTPCNVCAAPLRP